MKSLLMTLQYFESTGKPEDATEVMELADLYLQKNLISKEIYAILETYVRDYVRRKK